MNNVLNYNIAFKKPFSDMKKLLIGLCISIASSIIILLGKFDGSTLLAVLTFIGLLIGFLISGYYVRVAELTLKRNNEMPEWEDWQNLFLKGLFITVIGLLYSLPVILLALVFGGISVFMNKADPSVLTGNIKIIFAIVILCGIFIAYILPSAILGFIKHKKFRAAFDFKTVFKKAMTKNYTLAWIISFGYAMILGFILYFIPYIGTSIASFITGITGMTLLAEAYTQ